MVSIRMVVGGGGGGGGGSNSSSHGSIIRIEDGVITLIVGSGMGGTEYARTQKNISSNAVIQDDLTRGRKADKRTRRATWHG
jgi:hypothetical protein